MIIFFNKIPIHYTSYESLMRLLIQPNIKTVTCINQYYFNLVYRSEIYDSWLLKINLIHSDGIGMKLLPLFFKGKFLNVPYTTGSDFYLRILEFINRNRKSIFLFGDRKDILVKTKKMINKLYPFVEIKGFLDGYRDLNDDRIIESINRKKPDFLFVGLGAPRQEKWISLNSNKINAEKIIAVGGWFRVLAEDRKRGPLWAQKIGMEWFVRLLTEPKYVWKRYIIGIPLFIVRIIILKLKKGKEY